jgi:hypothetical protein
MQLNRSRAARAANAGMNMVHQPNAHPMVIDVWRRKYSEERPKKVLRGLSPVQDAEQLKRKELAKPLYCALDSEIPVRALCQVNASSVHSLANRF